MPHFPEIVLLLGMERYRRDFFRQVEARVRRDVPGFRLSLFEDRDTFAGIIDLLDWLVRDATLDRLRDLSADPEDQLENTVSVG